MLGVEIRFMSIAQNKLDTANVRSIFLDVLEKETVEEKLGREWDPQEMHVSLISLSGNVVEDDDYFAVERNN